MPFIEEAIEPGSVVHTDGWSIRSAETQGLLSPHHLPEGTKGIGVRAAAASSSCGLFAERWLLGTHQGAVSKEHLDYCNAPSG
jgi:hypothetical protein